MVEEPVRCRAESAGVQCSGNLNQVFHVAEDEPGAWRLRCIVPFHDILFTGRPTMTPSEGRSSSRRSRVRLHAAVMTAGAVLLTATLFDATPLAQLAGRR